MGIPVVESMRAAFPEPWQQAPPQWIGRPDGGLTEVPNSAWEAHTFMGYGTPGGGNQLALYGVPRSLEEYCEQAQVANYVQYRALLEAWTSSMWERYSGVLVRAAPALPYISIRAWRSHVEAHTLLQDTLAILNPTFRSLQMITGVSLCRDTIPGMAPLIVIHRFECILRRSAFHCLRLCCATARPECV